MLNIDHNAVVTLADLLLSSIREHLDAPEGLTDDCVLHLPNGTTIRITGSPENYVCVALVNESIHTWLSTFHKFNEDGFLTTFEQEFIDWLVVESGNSIYHHLDENGDLLITEGQVYIPDTSFTGLAYAVCIGMVEVPYLDMSKEEFLGYMSKTIRTLISIDLWLRHKQEQGYTEPELDILTLVSETIN